MDKETNDALRAKIPYIVPPDVLVITRGIAALGPIAVADILLKVKEFNTFNSHISILPNSKREFTPAERLAALVRMIKSSIHSEFVSDSLSI